MVTVLDEATADKLSLGGHLINGLQDIISGNVVSVQDETELARHLDALFQDQA